MKKSNNNTFLKYWLPVILWAGFIYLLSNQPSLKSPFDPLWDTILRKFAHMAEFGVLAFLMARALNFHGINNGANWFLVMLASAIYAVYDEVHQSYVQGRFGTVRDMILDFNGAFLGLIAWNLIQIRKKKKKRSR